MASVKETVEFIKAHDNFLITGHVFPDGDNIGSALALQEMMSSIGKKCAIYIEGPVPKIHQWMPGADEIQKEIHSALARLDITDGNPTVLIVDSSDPSRMGVDFMEWFESRSNLDIINIDHHVSNAEFGTINLINPRCSSVGEILFELVSELGLVLTKSIATNIFVSIYTDTGRFSFSNTSARSLRYASECVKAGARPNVAFRNLYASRSMESFHLQQESFKTLTGFLDGEGYYFYVDRKMLEETNTELQDTEGLIDVVRTLEGFSIVVFFKEVGENDIRVSIRAHHPINANLLMTKFGGGGHPRAAGCRIPLPLKEAIDHFVRVAEESIRSGEILEDDKRAAVRNADPFH